MGLRGPPKKPTALKEAQGVPGGKHKLQKREPRPRRMYSTRAPADLPPAVRRVWNQLARELIPLGLFTRLDMAIFRRYCDMRVRWEAMRVWLDTRGLYYPTYEDRTPAEVAALAANPQADIPRRIRYLNQWPQVAQYNNLSRDLGKIEQQFGMTPAARASISAPSRTADEQEIADFIQEGREKHIH